LQALVLLNDPTILEASRVMAERLMLEPTAVHEKIEKAFRQILCRKPESKESNQLQNYFQAELTGFRQKPEKARQFISAGEYRHEQIEDLYSLAALMQVIHTLYNLDEAITKS
jgi:hypothetical protein